MGVVIARWGLVGFMVLSALVLGSQAKAEEWKMEQGGIEPGKVVLGMRAGFAPLTQSLTNEFPSSTGIGSLVNFQAMYSLNKWLLVGMMLEWERHGVDTEGRFPVDRGVAIVARVGHFCVQRELFGEHVVGAPAESPGEGVAGGNGSSADLTAFSKAVDVHAKAHVGIGTDRAKSHWAYFDCRQHRHGVLVAQVPEGPFLIHAMAFPFQHHPD